jgi:hypothetical protein
MEEYQAVFQGGGTAAAGKPAAPPAPAPSAAAKPAAAAGAAGKALAGKTTGMPTKAAGPSAPSDDQEGVCQFCGGCGPHATEAQLDLHYWQACPLLTACPRCQQIVEIATLQVRATSVFLACVSSRHQHQFCLPILLFVALAGTPLG